MSYIDEYINLKLKIQDHNIEIGNLNRKIGNFKLKISQCENGQRDTPYYWTRQWVYNNLKDYLDSFDDSLSLGQYESKKWIIEELRKINIQKFQHIEIIGGWFGYPFIEFLDSFIDIKQIDFYEIDNNCKKVLAQYINNFKPKFKISMFDDYFQRKDLRRRNMIINTSSEHMMDIVKMKSYYKNYPEYPILVIQSNDYTEIKDHINCVESEAELIEKNEIKQVYYSGSYDLPLYKRYMVIGRW